jgi:hypothetical protein
LFQDAAFRNDVLAKASLPPVRDNKLLTGIIVANRMFAGLRVQGHPVRGSYELSNFITTGIVNWGDESKSLWKGEQLTAEDLRFYFDEDSTCRPFWENMERELVIHSFKRCTVEIGRYGLDILGLARCLGFSKAVEDLLALAIKQEEAKPRNDDYLSL